MKENGLPAVANTDAQLLSLQTIKADIRSSAAAAGLPRPSFEVSASRSRVEWAIVTPVMSMDAPMIAQWLIDAGYDVHGLEDGTVGVLRVGEADVEVSSEVTETFRASTAFGCRDSSTLERALSTAAWMLDRPVGATKLVEVTARLWHVHADGERVGTIVRF